MNFGFSYIGFIFLIMLMVPNLAWTKNQPVDYEKYVVNENKILLIMERMGEVLVTCCVLIFSDFNIKSLSVWSLWLVAAFLLLGIYGKNICMIIAVVILGIGHIGIHLNHRKEIK